MLTKIKQRIKKYIYGNKYKKYKKYCKKNNQKEYLIFNTPKHGNIGDQAIIYAEYKIFEKKNIKIFEISTYEEKLYFDSIKKNISKDAILSITGGGFIGSQWLCEQNLVNKVVNEFYNHKIIIFPQTIYFKEDEQGKEELKKSIEIFNKAENLIIFAREEKSYNFAKKTYKNAKVILVPDIVLSLENMQFNCKRENILCVMRKDPEGIFSEEDKLQINHILQKYGLPIKQTDTVVERSIPVANRTSELESKLKQFASAKLVVTDRLHGMIFASITNTPCIVLSNYNYKVEGVYQWIKDVDPNIIFEREIQNIEKDVERLMNVKIDENRRKNYDFENLHEILDKSH